MQKGWLVATVLLILLILPSALADCYITNVCDDGHATRFLDATDDARRHYLGMATLFQDEEPTSAAYPAVLFYASQPDTASMAGQILTDELDAQSLASDAHESAFYLAWTITSYSDALEPEVVTAATTALNDYISSSTTPSKLEDKFLRMTAIYLGDDGSDKAALSTQLRNAGDDGWAGLETNPVRLAKIVTALAALYDVAPDIDIRKLAEMNLDVLFTRFAASSVGGAWVSPTAGNRIAMMDTPKTPWYGWSFLVLGDAEKGSTTEPSMIVSNYCAHGVTRGISGDVRRIFDEIDGDALATVVTPDYALGAARDDSNTFNPSDGYVTKAKLRFGDYKRFIELNSRTCPETEDDQEDEDTETFLLDNRVMLGHLDSATDVCGEPHALFGVGFEASHILVDNIPHGLVVEAGDEYAILRFLGPTQQSHISLRYANRSNHLPGWLLNDGGYVLYPTGTGVNSGVFSLEVAPQEFVNEVTDPWSGNSRIPTLAARSGIPRAGDLTIPWGAITSLDR